MEDSIRTSNGRQDIRQNQCTMKIRSQRPTFILRSNVGLHKTHNPTVRHSYNPKIGCSYIKWSSRYKAKSLDHEI